MYTARPRALSVPDNTTLPPSGDGIFSSEKTAPAMPKQSSTDQLPSSSRHDMPMPSAAMPRNTAE
jgi:hypothetical protein